MDMEKTDRTRVVIVSLTLVIGVIVALVPLALSLSNDAEPSRPAASSAGAPAGAGTSSASDASGVLEPEGLGEAAGPLPESVDLHRVLACPEGTSDTAGGTSAETSGGTVAANAELAALALPCLTAGQVQDITSADIAAGVPSMAQSLAGKVSIVNVWAWWCGPCRAELPVMQELASKHPEWNVVGVHSDRAAQAGVDMLEELGVTQLPSYQDNQNAFGAAGQLPRVVPLTLVYRPDGTRAALLVKVFEDIETLEQAIQEALAAPTTATGTGGASTEGAGE